MAIPNNGWLPQPINTPVTQFTLPEVLKVRYYVCNLGPYSEKLQENPQIETLLIEQLGIVDAGYKNGVWGWYAGIDWVFAYGDGLIESVWPPLEPTVIQEVTTPEALVDETCPPDPILVAETLQAISVSADSKASVVLVNEQDVKIGVTSETLITPTIIPDAKGI